MKRDFLYSKKRWLSVTPFSFVVVVVVFYCCCCLFVCFCCFVVVVVFALLSLLSMLRQLFPAGFAVVNILTLERHRFLRNRGFKVCVYNHISALTLPEHIPMLLRQLHSIFKV